MERELIKVAMEYVVNMCAEDGYADVRDNNGIIAQISLFNATIKCGSEKFDFVGKSFIDCLKEKKILVDNAAYWYIYEDCSGHLEVDGLEIASFDGYTSEVRFPPQNNWIMTGMRGLEGVKEYIRRKLNLQVESNVCV